MRHGGDAIPAARAGAARGAGAGCAPRRTAQVRAGPRGSAPVAASRPVVLSRVTRGTTGAQRLRRVDRWLVGARASVLRAAERPLVVDLGFGARPGTTVELAARLARVRADVEVVGVEVDPARVAAARAELARRAADAAPPGGAPDGAGPVTGAAVARVRFAVGGFELAGLPAPVVVRAANVLRQYDEAEVVPAWRAMARATAPGGLLVDATCDEVGRRAAWVEVRVASDGSPRPVSLTLSVRLAGLERPGEVAARLPKVLIHRNVPGEGVHAWLRALDDAWARAAPLGALGARQRWVAACTAVAGQGWPVLGGPARWRLGEVGVAWSAVAPSGGGTAHQDP